MSAVELPPEIDEVVALLAGLPGAVAVALGGSRVTGVADAHSDWDLAVYYRGGIELGPLSALGEVHPPGSWGRLMNGGAWLRVAGHDVDVLLRDLDVVERWTAAAARGEFEVDQLLGYVAGCPTYLLAGERALGRVVRGALAPVGPYPEALAAGAPTRWRFHRDFSLEHAHMRAARGDVVGAVAQAARAVIEEAHARLAARRTWVLNEKRIVSDAGLAPGARFAPAAEDPAALTTWVEAVGKRLRNEG